MTNTSPTTGTEYLPVEIEQQLNDFGMFVCGGAIIREIWGEDPRDYDFFGPWEALLDAAAYCDAHFERVDGKNVPTYQVGKNIQIQLCLAPAAGVIDAVSRFDIRACQIYRINGVAIPLNSQVEDDINAREINILRHHASTEFRVNKYLTRGWTCAETFTITSSTFDDEPTRVY